jgi:hypothetical protein
MDAAATTCAKSELWCARARAPRPPAAAATSRACTLRPRLATNPLNRYTAIDYFAITHFYERDNCLNEQALAQGLHRSDTRRAQRGVLPARGCAGGVRHARRAARLRRMAQTLGA